MARTQDTTAGRAARPPTTWRERVFVLGGFAVAALYTVGALDAGLDAAGPLWLAAVLWTVPASLVLALRRGFIHRDWSAFRDCELPDSSALVDGRRHGDSTYMARWNGRYFDSTGYLTH